MLAAIYEPLTGAAAMFENNYNATSIAFVINI